MTERARESEKPRQRYVGIEAGASTKAHAPVSAHEHMTCARGSVRAARPSLALN